MEILSDHPFYEFATIILIATILGALGRLLKQPLIVTFIAVGIIVGPSGLDMLASKENIELLAEIGIAILLFVVGLKLDIKLIKTTGPVALVSGLGQVVFTSVFGYIIALSLGFSPVHSLYIAVALTFSSTIIIVKMLSDKKEIDKLHGQIAMGFLIVQDIVVVIVMIVISAFGAGEEETNIWKELLVVFIKGAVFIVAIGLLMRYVIPWVVEKLANNQELLILSAIAWAVSLASIGDYLGFSKEVGAFLGGVSLASTQFREVISGRLGSIRDFLLLFFFINLGSDADLSAIGDQIVPGIILSAFVLIGNPIIVIIIMGIMGYRKKTSFKAGLTVAQISEFSLILASLGLDHGHIDDETVGIITLVGLITISISTYMILYSEAIYNKIAPLLSIFEKSHPTKGKIDNNDTNVDYIIIGLGRFGSNIANNLLKKGHKIMAVDFDPSTVVRWQKKEVDAQFGDAEDPALAKLLPIANTKDIICTVTDLNTNIRLLKFMKDHNYKGNITVVAHSDDEEKILKKNGAFQVLRPFQSAANAELQKILT